MLVKLKKILKTPKHKLLFLLTFFVIIILIFQSVPKKIDKISDLNPSTTEVSSAIPQAKKQTVNPSLIKNLPTAVKSYKQEDTLITSQKAFEIASKAGFDHPKEKNGNIIAQQNSSSIIINTREKIITHTKPFAQIGLSSNQLKQLATKEISKFTKGRNIWKEHVILTQQKQDDKTKSLTTIFHFFPKTEGVRIISSSKHPIGEAGVGKVTFYHDRKTLTTSIQLIEISDQNQLISMLSAEEIENKILENKTTPSIIYENENSHEYQKTTLIPSTANFNQYELVYYYDTDQSNNFLTPMIIVSGTTILNNNEAGIIKSLIFASN